MIYSVSDSDPTSNPGCWMRFPSGCPTWDEREEELKKRMHFQPYDPSRWYREAEYAAHNSEILCRSRRKSINAECGVSDVIFRFVPGSVGFNERDSGM